MLDLLLLRRDPELIRRSALRRGIDPSFVDRVLEVDERLRASQTAVEAAKAEKNALTAAISKASDRAAEAGRLRPQIAELDERIAAAGAAVPGFENERDAILADVPNVIDDSVPDGAGEAANVEVRASGRPPELTFTPGRIGKSASVWASSISSAPQSFRAAGSRSSAGRARASRARWPISFWTARATRATSKSSRRISLLARRCGRPASSRSFPTKCSATRMRICS